MLSFRHCLTALIVALITSCGVPKEEYHNLREENTQLTAALEKMRAERDSLQERAITLEWRVNNVRADLRAFCEHDPDFALRAIDSELNAVETGTGLGSFSDFFVPRVYEAFDMGVPQSAINSRLDWLMALLEAGKPMSSSVVEDPEYFQSSMEAMRHLADQKERASAES